MKNAVGLRNASDYPGVDRAARHVLDRILESRSSVVRTDRPTSIANSRAIYIWNTTLDCSSAHDAQQLGTKW